MGTDDVNSNEPKYTAHIVLPDEPYLLGNPSLRSGSVLHMADAPAWPPDSLFDAVYVHAVLHHFGIKELGRHL